MERIDHTKCQHEATPKARKACRKAKRSDTPAPVQGIQAKAEPFTKRAIVVNFVLKDGKRYSVTFDRYGMNSELYRTALSYGWSAERTVNQAISEAISAVGKAHGFDKIDMYTLVEVD